MSETDLPDPEERRIHTLSPEERRREAIEHLELVAIFKALLVCFETEPSDGLKC